MLNGTNQPVLIISCLHQKNNKRSLADNCYNTHIVHPAQIANGGVGVKVTGAGGDRHLSSVSHVRDGAGNVSDTLIRTRHRALPPLSRVRTLRNASTRTHLSRPMRRGCFENENECIIIEAALI